MTKKDIKRCGILEEVVKGKYTIAEASRLLNISKRQVQRLKKAFLEKGVDGIIHKKRGKKPNNAKSDELVKKVVSLKKEYMYEKANFTHFKELLKEKENIDVSYSWLYSTLTKNNIQSHKKHKKAKLHHRRKRKDYFGEFVQTDGTPYDWFGIGKKYSLHGYIDDATGIPLALYMCESECLLGYLEITRIMLEEYGCPETIYSDRYSVFFPSCSAKLTIEEQLQGLERPKTQFYNILENLNINLIAAGSSQAKGRIERLWGTLQDRLVTEFRINNITTIKDANIFLKNYCKTYGKKFGIKPEKEDSKFIKLPKNIDLDMLLTTKFTRCIDNSGCFSFYNKKFQVITDTIPARSKITILMSEKIGIKAMYNDKLYNVITCNSLPTHNTSKEFNKIFKEKEVDNFTFATYILSLDAKQNSPLLISS